ncbi:hypothetical protein LOTGIDRAFT_111480, partial [Lottia gigantea]
DEITDCKDTTQLAIFVRDVDEHLNVTDKLLSLQSMKDTTTGLDILTEVLKAAEKFNLDRSTFG